MDVAALTAFVASYPTSPYTGDALFARELLARLEAIRRGDVEPDLVIPQVAFGDRWGSWRGRINEAAVMGLFCERGRPGTDEASLGVGSPFPFFTTMFAFDEVGRPSLALVDGSIDGFGTQGLELELCHGVLVNSLGYHTVYFGAAGDRGLVRLCGACEVTLDGGARRERVVAPGTAASAAATASTADGPLLARIDALQALALAADEPTNRPLAIETAVKLLADPTSAIRYAAVYALRTVGDESSLEPLKAALGAERNERVAEAIKTAVAMSPR